MDRSHLGNDPHPLRSSFCFHCWNISNLLQVALFCYQKLNFKKHVFYRQCWRQVTKLTNIQQSEIIFRHTCTKSLSNMGANLSKSYSPWRSWSCKGPISLPKSPLPQSPPTETLGSRDRSIFLHPKPALRIEKCENRTFLT